MTRASVGSSLAEWAKRLLREQRGSATLQWALAAAAVAAVAALSASGAGDAAERAARRVEAGIAGPQSKDANQEAFEGAQKAKDLLDQLKERRPENERARLDPDPEDD